MENILTRDNPFFEIWDTPFATPPFDRIRPEHFMSAFEHGFADRKLSLDALISNPEPATFENVIVALEKTGSFLDRVLKVFHCFESTGTTDEIQKIAAALAPMLSQQRSEIFQNEKLYAKVDAVFKSCQLLSTAQQRLVEKYHRSFRQFGVHLSKEARDELKAINLKLSGLTLKLEQNNYSEGRAFTLPLVSETDIQGLSEGYLKKAEEAAADHGMAGQRVATLGMSASEQFLTESSRREHRETLFRAWKARGANANQHNNVTTLEEVARLRARYAKILGFETFAHLQLSNLMTQKPEAVRELHKDVWGPARGALMRDAVAVEEAAKADGMNEPIQAWDWRYYADKVRQAHYAVDGAEVSQYLEINQCLGAMFYTANRLFGLNFIERHDITTMHPDIRTWEVTDEGGRHVAVFYGDYFARAGKRDGAHMDIFRAQNRLDHINGTPLVYNVCNFGKPSPGSPALLSIDDFSGTLFHEFGHALHVMLSNTDYPLLSGTNVLKDFVELPSQLFELWAFDEAVLPKFAKHYKTGEVMPVALRNKVRAAHLFDQGAKTAEYIASSALDLELHSLRDGETISLQDIEKKVVSEMGLPGFITPRHRLPHFGHIARGYAGQYVVYLVADKGVAAVHNRFKEVGDVFDPSTAARLKLIYSSGDSEAPDVLTSNFCGHTPSVEPLLKQRGFSSDGAEREPKIPKTSSAIGSSVEILAL